MSEVIVLSRVDPREHLFKSCRTELLKAANNRRTPKRKRDWSLAERPSRECGRVRRCSAALARIEGRSPCRNRVRKIVSLISQKIARGGDNYSHYWTVLPVDSWIVNPSELDSS